MGLAVLAALVVAAAGVFGLGGRADDGRDGSGPAIAVPEPLTVRVVRRLPHARDAFTQGLVLHDGTLYEGTGLYGASTLRRVTLETGMVERRAQLPPELFGEGIALVRDRIVQLTWREGIALVWDAERFERVGEHRYRGEGWGLCFDGRRLVMSDGSDTLVFRDPDSFEITGRVRVRRAGRPLAHLNELECVDDLVYANVWQTDHIARIDPRTGAVTGWIDTALHPRAPEGLRLLPPELADDDTDVLNGIAYDARSGRFLLTGKRWPELYEVQFVPRSRERSEPRSRRSPGGRPRRLPRDFGPRRASCIVARKPSRPASASTRIEPVCGGP
ncbi:MAG: glutaminyl-peptide cyclotransferase [Myxococcota bacterium]|nr:glutaminyl-peptide cyclotransferase [Myxococcota bacterium]